jgi:hypothetical protein
VDKFEPDSESDVESIESGGTIFSDTPSTSSVSSLGLNPGDAVKRVSAAFIQNGEMFPLYRDAEDLLDQDRFMRNHDRLLRRYFVDLKCAAENSLQLGAVRYLRGTDQRNDLTNEILKHVRASSSHDDRKRMNFLSKERVDQHPTLNRFLESEPSHLDDGDETQNSSEENSEDSDSDSSENFQEELEETTLSEIESVLQFLITSDAFDRFKNNLRLFIHPPNTVQQALAINDYGALLKLLIKSFNKAATGEYAWLQDLDAARYSR